jgi:hypothetical protein
MTVEGQAMQKPVKEFAEELSDAYSTDAYGGWEGCILALRRRGYDDRQIEAIIRSKYTRWAADENSGTGTPKGLLTFIDDPRNEVTPKEIEDIATETPQLNPCWKE